MTNQSPRPIGATLREARQLAALTQTIRENLGGAAVDAGDVELIGLASDISVRIYADFLHSPCRGDNGAMAFGIAGKLSATLEAICDLNPRAAAATNDDERDALVTRIGWLQNSADDLAEELTQAVDVLAAWTDPQWAQSSLRRSA